MATGESTVVPITPQRAEGTAKQAAISEEERAQLSDKALAKAVLARQFQPRVGEVRRLAEAVLTSAKASKPPKASKTAKPAKSDKPAKPKKANRKKAQKSKKAAKKA